MEGYSRPVLARSIHLHWIGCLFDCLSYQIDRGFFSREDSVLIAGLTHKHVDAGVIQQRHLAYMNKLGSTLAYNMHTQQLLARGVSDQISQIQDGMLKLVADPAPSTQTPTKAGR